jgi:glycosyltransferase involved in cell wall biosynthesis
LLSSDAALVKAMGKPPGCVHVCYCHSPPRYLWDMSDEYLARTGGLGGVGRAVFRRVIPGLRAADREAADRVDHFIANSRFVAERIRRCYGREAEVVHPPVEVERFVARPAVSAAGAKDAGYYLVVSELVAYKRVDLAAAACARSGRRLVVVGDGPEAGRLRREFAGAGGVEFRGRLADAEVAELLAGCRALIHPQLEDFGITAVEAQAAGRPVVAYRGGGALETVVEGVTGEFFDAQEEDALAATLARMEARAEGYAPDACRRQAERFAPAVFRAGLRERLAKWVG